MARKLRLEFSGACYHVINRGNYRRDLFFDSGAASSFVRCLAEAATRFRWRVHAFVVMRNHFHLAVETPEPNLSRGMQWLQSTWARRFNNFREETGRPFQSRYRALHVQPGQPLAQVAHYIHLNPVRAGIVTAEQLLEYRWSSLAFAQHRHQPAWLELHTVLRESGGLADSAAGWRSYVEYLGLQVESDASARNNHLDQLSRGWAIGSEEFQADLARQLAGSETQQAPFQLLGGDRVAHEQVRTKIWEEKLQCGAAALGISLENLPNEKSAFDKVRLAALLKTATSVSNCWLTRRLGMGKATSVSQFVGRFQRRGGMEASQFKAALSKVVA